MVASRRPEFNFALEHAISIAERLGKPLLVLEALRAGYPWASDRLHAFVLDGMAANAAAFARAGVTYYPYVERKPGEGKGLVETLAQKAVAIVSDEFPCFFLPRMQEAVAPRLPVRFEVVDGNGLLPLRAADRAYLRAVDFRRFVQRSLATQLETRPRKKPLANLRLPAFGALPRRLLQRWPMASTELLSAAPAALARLAIDHGVPRVEARGGYEAGRRVLRRFIHERLERYAEDRNHPDLAATSELSPYLHFGHLAADEVFDAVARAEDLTPGSLGDRRRGERDGFWQLRPGAEAFLDQLVTWRELGFNYCHHRPDDYARYDALPEWARKTLAKHARDRRDPTYSLEQLKSAETYDVIWNAAQRELVRTGRLHNYLRMLWGKKVIEWSRTPGHALEALLDLNNRYALDGRNPNSYSGIFWCFGRFDRAWGPERPIFGTVRYLSSDNTRRKLRLRAYLERYGP